MYYLIAPKRDCRYVKRVVREFYGRWVKVLCGEEPRARGYVIELRTGYGGMRLETPVKVVAYSGSRSLSTLAPMELVKLIERARAKLRLTASFDGCHRLDEGGMDLYGLEPHPGYDIYFMLGDHVKELLMELGVRDPPSNPLALRRFGGVHDIYSGASIKARLRIPDTYGRIVVENYDAETIDNDFNALVEANKNIIKVHEMISRALLEELSSPDIVFVSFSGGKDSVAALDIVLKCFGKDRVVPVFVDTGLEFPQTIDYVRVVEEHYGIEVVKVYAGVDKAVAERGLPTPDNRWCTMMKRRAFEEKVRELSRGHDSVVVVVGDRDAESASRSHRPPVRRRKGYIEVAPIKQWSTAHVQLYTIMNGLPENPLYELGFYRTGCYICPSLRALELYIMRTRLWSILRGYRYINEFYRAKSRGK